MRGLKLLFGIFVLVLLVNGIEAQSDKQNDLAKRVLESAGGDPEKIKQMEDVLSQKGAGFGVNFDKIKSVLFYVLGIGLGLLIILIGIIFVKKKLNFKREMDIPSKKIVQKPVQRKIPRLEQQLQSYLLKAKKQGLNRSQIRSELSRARWPKKLIDKYL